MDNVSESHVEVKESKTAGNGLFATEDIGAGELVLMIKRPLVGVLDIPRLEDTCSNCFMWSMGSVEDGLTVEKPTVNACAGCKQVKYCSKVSKSLISKNTQIHFFSSSVDQKRFAASCFFFLSFQNCIHAHVD